MSKPDAPTPPDPNRTASAATATNVSTAIANAFLNNTGQITPEGELRYDPTGTYTWTDPTGGQVYNIPTFTATQIRSPQQQAIADQQNAAKYNLAGLGNSQSARISDLLQGNIDLSQAPSAGNPYYLTYNSVAPANTTFADAGAQQTSIGPYGSQQFGFGDAGSITGSYGPGDFSADRANVEQALFNRLQPQLDRDRTRLETQLADQGIRYGSPAYAQAMDDFNRQSNDARLAVTAQAGQEQQRMMDMAAKRAGFENAAQMQAYQQAQGRGEFYNTAQAQQLAEQLQAGQFTNAAQQAAFQQAAQRGQFANAGLAQQLAQQQSWFNALNAVRNQYMNEQYALRNQPINEITSLLSGSQVTNPNFVNAPNTQIPTVDIAGLINQNFAQQMGIYQTQNQNYQSLVGGALGAAGRIGGAFLSDVRAKEDMHRIGTVFAAGPGVRDVDSDEIKRLPIYSYSYKDDPASVRHVGPTAQDVEKIDPGAVTERAGMKHIYPRRVMGAILRAA